MASPRLEGNFVSPELDCSDFANLEPLYQALLDRPIESPEDAEQWLIDLSDLQAVVSEYGARRNIDLACHTEDKAIEAAYMNFIENVRPKIAPMVFKLQKKLIESPHAAALEATDPRYAVLLREWRTDVEIYRDENVPLQTEVTRLTTEYNKLRGAMTVEFDGREQTLQQLARYLEEPDRSVRESAWQAGEQRQAQDRERQDEIFDKLLDLRHRIATNAGLPDFRAYTWKAYGRFDYEPADCVRFADAIEQTFMPLVERLDEERAERLGLDRLRPWDLAVDPRGRPPLRPFDPADINRFVANTKAIFERLSPQLAEDFASLSDNGNLDLESRKAKRPGGFQSTLNAVRQPFIFMNAAGVQRDVDTLLHEGGHAFHTLAAREEPLTFLRHAPIEFCEVASMTMELLGCDHYDTFYDDSEEAARAKRRQLEGIIRFFPWMATVDQFQHWLYTHPDHTRAQRTEAWLEISGRFTSPLIDWSGLEEAQRSRWQRQLHIFCYPFYYVEYGIAQIGALQVWRNARQDCKQALADYRKALSLGGTRPLPELFAAAGIDFDFSAETIAPLVDQLGKELEKLQE